MSKAGKRMLDGLTKGIDDFRSKTEALEHALEHSASGSVEQHARYFRDQVIPKMAALRDAGDKLELVIPSDTWPLPTYREMLFIK